MNERDLRLRALTYSLLVEFGRAPTAGEVADAGDLTVADVASGWWRLHEHHALVLDPVKAEIRMANRSRPCRRRTGFRPIDARGYANCAWDAFGICAALHVDGRIETTCPDCGDAVNVELRDQRPDDGSLLFHCLVSAVRWWDDIVFT